MSIAVRITPSNMTRQQYDSVRNALTASGDWPADGCQLHVLSGEEGDLRVSEVWESREKFDAFGEKLGPRIEEAGIQMSGDPEVVEAHIVETFQALAAPQPRRFQGWSPLTVPLTGVGWRGILSGRCRRRTSRVVRKLYEGRGSDFYDFLDPHVVFLNYASAPEPGPYIGHEGIHEWAKAFRIAFGDFKVHATEFIDAGGDQVVGSPCDWCRGNQWRSSRP